MEIVWVTRESLKLLERKLRTEAHTYRLMMNPFHGVVCKGGCEPLEEEDETPLPN